MKKAFLLIALFCLGFVFRAYSQSFNVRSIFNSGATFGCEYLAPSSINDSTDFQQTKYKVQFVKVLRTKEVDLERFNMKDSDAKANQLFLASRFSLARPRLSTDNYFNDIYRAEFELTYISASWKRGLWVHAVNISAVESEETYLSNISPNFRAYSIYVHVKNFDFVPFIGPGLTVYQGKFLPVPVFGFRAKITPKFVAELIVPVHAKLKYELPNADLELVTYYSAINAIYREGSHYKDNDNTLNLQQLKSYFAVNTKLSEHYKFKVELGYAFYQQIDALSTDFVQDMSSMPFVNVSLNYNFANSILYRFFNDPDKIKEKRR